MHIAVRSIRLPSVLSWESLYWPRVGRTSIPDDYRDIPFPGLRNIIGFLFLDDTIAGCGYSLSHVDYVFDVLPITPLSFLLLQTIQPSSLVLRFISWAAHWAKGLWTVLDIPWTHVAPPPSLQMPSSNFLLCVYIFQTAIH